MTGEVFAGRGRRQPRDSRRYHAVKTVDRAWCGIQLRIRDNPTPWADIRVVDQCPSCRRALAAQP